MTGSAQSPFDGAQFRRVLGHFPTGVTIVTGWSGDAPAGFTIGSFTSVSLEPPLVAFLPQVQSDTWQAMAPAGKFCVNVLRDDQSELCWRFARKGVGDGRFDDLAWTPSPTGCPILDGVGAWIDCTVEDTAVYGDHYLVVGRVVDLSHHEEPHTPLVFYKGALGGFLAAE
ncbi:MAG: flavin reductase family protein [Actinomycetota bacterium]|nr:flavin reductase [Acidimicrobiia bacterium]MDQ3469755.1 flavin reductase family protein [Actinomycetota bacterium]